MVVGALARLARPEPAELPQLVASFFTEADAGVQRANDNGMCMHSRFGRLRYEMLNGFDSNEMM